nr:MAG TPA: hypothetical protein [Caudoviricetes sp.]
MTKLKKSASDKTYYCYKRFGTWHGCYRITKDVRT